MQIEKLPSPFNVGMTHRTDVRPLSSEEVNFEIDMCIGCDRCMRACPVPLSTQITIGDLNRATVSTQVSTKVARFTDECVMCGSCVPVCPVDNHRDLLMLSLKQRLGVPWDGQVDLAQGWGDLPTGWSIPLLVNGLRAQTLFKNASLVPDNYLLHFIAASQLHVLPPGVEMMREGDFGRDIYFLLNGRCEVFSSGTDEANLPQAIVQQGEYVGEQGMLTGQARNITVRTQTEVTALKVPEQVMQRLIEIIPSVQDFFEQLSNLRAVENVLLKLDLFQGISAADMHQLASEAAIRRYDRAEKLFGEDKQGQPSRETFHLLLDGFVKVARKTGREQPPERIIAYRQRGDYFVGGLDMLGDRRAVTVSAITRVSVAEIARPQLKNLLVRYPDFKQRLQERIQLYHDATTAAYSAVFEPFDRAQLQQVVENTYSNAEARAGLHALVGAGVVEGTEVLVIDLNKCIHCNECEDACERRHGQSRMNREGMVVGNISVVNACRQCQDPVCMLCSRAGIARKPSGEVYITESCIGCGICAERCPYDNISIVSLADEAEPESAQSWQRFSNLFRKGARKGYGKRPLPMAQAAVAPGPLQPLLNNPLETMRKKIAIKCDLCAGYGNQACVQACPTGAAIRINPVTFFGSTEDMLGQRVR
jgi:Fe-S-cluster-containing hydrogenase component 2/CRP-like cAMP-binding protein